MASAQSSSHNPHFMEEARGRAISIAVRLVILYFRNAHTTCSQMPRYFSYIPVGMFFLNVLPCSLGHRDDVPCVHHVAAMMSTDHYKELLGNVTTAQERTMLTLFADVFLCACHKGVSSLPWLFIRPCCRIHIRACMHVCMHVCVLIHACMPVVCVCVCKVNMYSNRLSYTMHMYVCTHTHTHTDTHVPYVDVCICIDKCMYVI
jgi:hypothetical protein